MIITTYTDKKGFSHKVQLENDTQKPESGIRLSVDVEAFLTPYGLRPDDMVAIQQLLWQNEIVFASDYAGAIYDKVVSIFRSKLPPQEAKIIGNALIADIREVIHANGDTRYDNR